MPEGATHLGLSEAKFRREVAAGRIASFTIGTRRLVTLEALDAYIEQRLKAEKEKRAAAG